MRDKDIIEKLIKEDEEFRTLHKKHIEYEKQIEELMSQKPQTSELHFQIEVIKKKKLLGKDRMERILTRHR